MPLDYGPGTTRTLAAAERQFVTPAFMKGRPVLDSELALLGQIASEATWQAQRVDHPSGFFLDPTRACLDFQFNPNWTEQFVLGNPRAVTGTGENPELQPIVWACVNGWVIPVAGTNATDNTNVVRLYPPPASDSRIDFVFLEAWATRVDSNPSTVNKPSASTLWKYGNVQYGGTNLVDDLQDPAIGYRTTGRVQIQYRLRVYGQGTGLGASVALDVYPEGLGDPNVLGQGTSTTPVGGFVFTNMRETLGDPGLWRAGDGNPNNALGTVDGYVYAVPVCAVFRRNSQAYTAVTSSGNPNQNGAFCRTPGNAILPNPLTGARALSVPALAQTGTITIVTNASIHANDTVSIGGQTLTAVTGTPGSNQFQIGTSASITATNLAAAINGSSTFNALVTAYPNGALVTLVGLTTGSVSLSVSLNTAGCITLSGAALAGGNLSPTAGVGSSATVYVSNLANSALADTSLVLTSTFLTIDNEIIGISAVNVAGGTITIPAGGRGRYGTAKVGHAVGATIGFFNTRPDGLFADQIVSSDLLDLRHAITSGDWDYTRILQHNVGALLKGTLKSTWKASAVGDTQGTLVNEITFLDSNGLDTLPTMVASVDGPDGIRYIWSDAATVQPDVTVMLDNTAPQDSNQSVGLTNPAFDQGTNYAWDVTAGFYPSGFMNVHSQTPATGWANGSTIFLFTGGADGTGGARATFRDGTTRAVRMLMPKEWWKSASLDPTKDGNQYPLSLRFLDQHALEPAPPSMASTTQAARHVGPMYPWWKTNFERPFIVLGGLLNSSLRVTGVPATALTNPSGRYEINLSAAGLNFDTAGVFYPATGGVSHDDPTLVSTPLLRGQKTLWNMLTNGGQDLTGNSSQVYVVLYGDKGSIHNNGAFKVIGAGTVASGYTGNFASNATSLVVAPLSPEFTGFDSSTGNSVTVEFRSQESNSDDISSWNTKVADIAIVLTDIGGVPNSFYSGSLPIGGDHPWARTALGYGAGDGYDLSLPFLNSRAYPQSKMVIESTLLYHPGHSGFARVPDAVNKFSLYGTPDHVQGTYLRQSPGGIDTTFTSIGTPANEINWDPAQVQFWNRLSSMGWHAGETTLYGGLQVEASEQDREHELLIDTGSKTIVFRPFRDRKMTLHTQTFPSSIFASSGCLLGPYNYPTGSQAHKDALQMWTGTATTGKLMGIPVPREYMPRFGRQDIPYFQDSTGTQSFLCGINHLFNDSTNLASSVFNIIGGNPTTSSAPAVNSMFFVTGAQGVSPLTHWPTADYGNRGTGPAYINNLPFIWARRTGDINANVSGAQNVINALNAVHSSDLGQGLAGIQLPPYYGPARIYGVYDLRDFDAKSGNTFNASRTAMVTGAPPNLLREDADQQTLFILQDGAQDLTGTTGDHTYILPYNAIDISRALNYQVGDTPASYNFVVECSVFGFARGFINQNNLVLVRTYNGLGQSFAGSPSGNADGTDFEAAGVHMILPCPAEYHDQFYADYNRTVYQGDPFMSRNGTKTDGDYATRYGQLSMSSQYQMRTPIQQFDSSGNFVPHTPNARVFEVLASLDFYTTMGTGKIGGALLPGTILDVGFTQNTHDAANRQSSGLTQPAWKVLSRAYTEGQRLNPNHAMLDLILLNDSSNNPVDLNPVAGTPTLGGVAGTGSYATLTFNAPSFTAQTLWFSKAANVSSLTGAGIASQNIVTVDETRTIYELTPTTANPANTTLNAGSVYTQTVTVTGAAVGDAVILNPNLAASGVRVSGYVSAPNTVTLIYFNSNTASAFKLDTAQDSPLGTLTITGATVNANSSLTETVAVPGASLVGGQTFAVQLSAGIPAGPGYPALILNAQVNGSNTVQVTLYNPTGSNITLSTSPTIIEVMLLNPAQASTWQQAVTTSDSVVVTVIKSLYSPAISLARTANNLATTINAHTTLSNIVQALPPGQNGSKVSLQAITPGAAGNSIQVSAVMASPTPATYPIQNSIRLLAPVLPGTWMPQGGFLTSAYLGGGVDLVNNAGNGTSQIKLVGMTERLPLGALLQDSDFLCENPLNDMASAVKTTPTGPRPIQTLMPLTNQGGEYNRFFSEPGSLLGMSDGTICVTDFTAWTSTQTSGTKRFRIFRGGGPVFVMDGPNPGGPVDWASESFPAALKPVLKGGVLACRALLVRNFREEVVPGPYVVSQGDEIQMVIITRGILGDTNLQTNGLTLGGTVSPAGYGESWLSADRYRLEGKPLLKDNSRQIPNPAAVTIAPYPNVLRTY